MATLSQSKLQRRVEVFVLNGLLPQAQGILAGIGYDPLGLDAGSVMLTNWIAMRSQVKASLSEQKQATNAEEAAREAAHNEVGSLIKTIRILFGDDEVVMTALGLQTQYETVGEPGEETTAPVRPSEATADVIARWRLLMTNMQTLDAGQQALLTGAGWTTDRLMATTSLVEAYAAADTAQQEAIHTYHGMVNQAKDTELALRDWYSKAARLSKVAIKTADPNNKTELLELLGL